MVTPAISETDLQRFDSKTLSVPLSEVSGVSGATGVWRSDDGGSLTDARCEGKQRDSLSIALLKLCTTEHFFEPCMTHMDAKKNECNFFWISDDFLSTSVVCRHCDEVAGDVDEGSLLQVRRYMHRNVVHVEDLSRAHDCRGIQSYV